MQNTLEHMYDHLVYTPSDINEHLPVLRNYASECKTVVECGTRTAVSSYAFGCALKDTPGHEFTMIDLYDSKEVDDLLKLAVRENLNAKFIKSSDLNCPVIETDLLFIDTWHVYGQLKRELEYWNSSVKKYIIMHDTTVDAVDGESIRCGLNIAQQSSDSGIPMDEIIRGLWPAITEFIHAHPEWVIEKRYTNNNGLTILKRV